MIDINRLTDFDWDKGNLNKNSAKHKVEYYEAEEIFFNEPLIILEDAKHSAQESRFYALGQTDLGRRIFLVFTARKDKIRIISARDMNKKESKIYEEAKNTKI